MDYVQLKSFYKAKKWSRKWKGNLSNGRKYLQIIYLVRGSYSEHIRISHDSREKKKAKIQQNNWVKKWAKELKRHFSKEDIQTANRSKVLNITNHQRNANQCHCEMSLHTYSMSNHIIRKTSDNNWWGSRKKKTLVYCLWKDKLVKPL